MFEDVEIYKKNIIIEIVYAGIGEEWSWWNFSGDLQLSLEIIWQVKTCATFICRIFEEHLFQECFENFWQVKSCVKKIIGRIFWEHLADLK